MDPFSITTGVLSLTGVCVTTAKRLSDLKTLISASLGQLQTALLRCSSFFVDQVQKNPASFQSLDTALIGCSMVFLALQEEVDKLELEFLKAGFPSEMGTEQMKWKNKIHLIWKEDTMKELLTQIRGQQTSMTLLLQALNMDSMADLHSLLKDNSTYLESLAASTAHLCKSYPDIRPPASIFDANRDDGISIYSNRASTAGATEFDFDDFVMESRVYRRAFMGGYLRPRRISLDRASVAQSEADSETETIRATDDADTNVDDIQLNKLTFLMVKTANGGELEMNAESISEQLARYDELLGRYRNVKRYYFDMDAQLRASQAEQKKAETEWRKKEQEWNQTLKYHLGRSRFVEF